MPSSKRGHSIGDGLSANDRWLIRRCPRVVMDSIVQRLGASQPQKTIAEETGVSLLTVSSIKKAMKLGVLEQTHASKPKQTTGHKRAGHLKKLTRARARDAALKRATAEEGEDPEHDPVYLANVLRGDLPTRVREQGTRERDAREAPAMPTAEETGAPVYTGLPDSPIAKDAASTKAALNRSEYVAAMRKALRSGLTPEQKADILLNAARSTDPKVAAAALKEINELDGTNEEIEKLRGSGGDEKPGTGMFLLPRGTVLRFSPVTQEDMEQITNPTKQDETP